MESVSLFVVGLLTAVLSLLGFVQQHPELPQASRDQAQQIAQQAITQATQTLEQTGSQTPATNANVTSECLVLTHDLWIGKSDEDTGGEVSKLQLWLKAEGYFPDAQGTGYYGEKTAGAMVKWQKAHGMDFVTTKSGVGKMTRAKMQEACSRTSSNIKIGNPYGGSYDLEAKIQYEAGIPIAVAEFHGGFNLGVYDGTSAPKEYVDFGDGASIAAEKTVCPGSDCYFQAKHLYPKAGTYTITLHTIENAKRINLTATKITVAKDGCEGTADAPYIAAILPISGPRGTSVEIWGCNLSGFEGDTDFTFESSYGQKVTIDGEASYRQSGGTSAKIQVQEPCHQGETVYGEYSGLPAQCVYTPILPGTYQVYVTPWSKKSNVVNFTVTQ